MAPAEEEAVVEAEVVPDDLGDERYGQELVATSPASATLFHTEEPAQVIAKAGEVANLLKDILKKQGLTTTISGRDHVQVEGWQTVGSMIGVFAVESWTRPVDGDAHTKGPHGYESRYEARTITGAVVGAGVARCTRSEKTWANRDDYALASMAQTRATSKALKAPLGWIVALAGYSATPAEEMPRESNGKEYGPVASAELKQKTAEALAALVGQDKVAVVTNKVDEDCGGYLPRVAARAICHTALVFITRFNGEEADGGEHRRQASPAEAGGAGVGEQGPDSGGGDEAPATSGQDRPGDAA